MGRTYHEPQKLKYEYNIRYITRLNFTGLLKKTKGMEKIYKNIEGNHVEVPP